MISVCPKISFVVRSQTTNVGFPWLTASISNAVHALEMFELVCSFSPRRLSVTRSEHTEYASFSGEEKDACFILAGESWSAKPKKWHWKLPGSDTRSIKTMHLSASWSHATSSECAVLRTHSGNSSYQNTENSLPYLAGLFVPFSYPKEIPSQ